MKKPEKLNIDVELAPCGAFQETKVAGGSIVEDKPCFTADSRFLFVINDGKVHSYSTSTGELVQCLEASSAIVGVCTDATNHRRVTTCDAKGNIITWDFLLGTSLKKQSLCQLTSDGSSVAGLLGPPSAAELYVLLRRPDSAATSDLVRPCLSGGRGRQLVHGVRRGAAGRWEVAFGDQGRLVAAIVDTNHIVVRNVWQKDKANNKQLNNLRTDAGRPFTCVACHQSEAAVAAGDSSGRLLLWRRLLSDEPPVSAVLHWHTLPLPTICFSPEGTHIMTGGDECVLVYWHAHDEKPTFLPRLGMPIRHVTCSPDGQLVVTSHADNVIRLVSGQRQVVRVIGGLTWATGDDPATGLVLEPRSGGILLNGAVGHLQLFSTHERRDLYSVDVVQTNYLTRERTGSPATCDVTRVAVTSDGDWMATLEERDDGTTTAERRLKFWNWDEMQQSYALNTCVDDPHDSPVTALVFRPVSSAKAAPLAVTTGTDGAVKYWSLVDDSDIYGSKRCWSCDAVSTHHGRPAGCASFSADGCRLAVGFSAAVTLWQPDHSRLLHTLSNLALRDHVRQVEFGRGSCSHLLVARADSGLRVWNLLSLTLCARIDLRTSLLVADPGSEYMAAFSVANRVFVFRPSSTQPVYQAALARRVTAACFVPHRSGRPDLATWQHKSQLYFLTDQHALHCLQRSAADLADLTDLPAGQLAVGPLTATPFSALLAEQSRSAATPAQQRLQSEVTPDLQRVIQMLESPSHTLPPLTRLCSTFLEGMLYPRDRQEQQPTEQAAPDTDGPADVAGGGDQLSGRRRACPPLHARLDHLLTTDMGWLTV